MEKVRRIFIESASQDITREALVEIDAKIGNLIPKLVKAFDLPDKLDGSSITPKNCNPFFRGIKMVFWVVRNPKISNL